MRKTNWTNDWKTDLLIQIMSRCLEVQAEHKHNMQNVTVSDVLVPDEYIQQGTAEFGAELELLMKDRLAEELDLQKLKEEEKM
jgi:hypothetical protein|tara:strand:- start:334 stop:582 length:249 start_codon:yes stop_codon:yes gene_type:complete